MTYSKTHCAICNNVLIKKYDIIYSPFICETNDHRYFYANNQIIYGYSKYLVNVNLIDKFWCIIDYKIFVRIDGEAPFFFFSEEEIESFIQNYNILE